MKKSIVSWLVIAGVKKKKSEIKISTIGSVSFHLNFLKSSPQTQSESLRGLLKYRFLGSILDLLKESES